MDAKIKERKIMQNKPKIIFILRGNSRIIDLIKYIKLFPNHIYFKEKLKERKKRKKERKQIPVSKLTDLGVLRAYEASLNLQSQSISAPQPQEIGCS